MRFMMIVIPRGYETAAPDAVPTTESVAKMMEYNKSLQKAGVLLALDGLFPPSTGARVSYADGKATVTDGQFVEAKEVIGGYWIIQVHSREEAIEWARRAPMSNNEIIEVRQIFEMADFPADAQKAAEGFDDLKAAAAAKALPSYTRRLRQCGRSSPHGSSPASPALPTTSALLRNSLRMPLLPLSNNGRTRVSRTNPPPG